MVIICDSLIQLFNLFDNYLFILCLIICFPNYLSYLYAMPAPQTPGRRREHGSRARKAMARHSLASLAG